MYVHTIHNVYVQLSRIFIAARQVHLLVLLLILQVTSLVNLRVRKTNYYSQLLPSR